MIVMMVRLLDCLRHVDNLTILAIKKLYN